MGAHFENFNRVDNCTYASGKIIGYVKDSYDNPIKNARVKIYNGSILKASLATDNDGCYSISKLPEADYTIKVYVTGYSAYETTEHVGRNETKYVETLIMLSRDEQRNGTGSVYGDIINAVTGEELNNVTYYIRKNWNNTSGEVIESGKANGSYDINLASGNYTIQFKAEKFIDTEINFAISNDEKRYISVALSPELVLPDDGLIRIVLSWGQTPFDLDSHLTGATLTGDSRYHIYYESEKYYDDETLLADLDLDDTSSYGPETITIHKMTDGIFHYYVHDYSNDGSEHSLEMSMSNAQVRVYKGKSLMQKFVVPTNMVGTYWHVFDIDKNGNIIGVNTMSNEFDDEP